jgi:hypothetical protein
MKMEDEEFEVSVGMSRKWDAREAGREVAENTLKKLNHDPSFFLLFSTIHYEKHGGFEEFLNGVWDVLPKGTPLIGGTVAGFMNAEGCYTRGASAIAVSYPLMDIAMGIGKNTKRFPGLAGKICAKNLLKNVKESKYEYRVCLDLISGVTMPRIPGKKRIVVLRNKYLAGLSVFLLKISTTLFQKGVAREEDVLQSLLEILGKGSYIFGGSTVDDNNFSRSYQFAGNKILTESIVTFALSLNKKPSIHYGHGFEPTNQSFSDVKLNAWGRMIKKIDGEPAVEKYLKTLNWSDDLIDEENFHRRLIFNPLGSRDEDGFIHPFVPGAFLGNNYVTGCPIMGGEINLLNASGGNLLSAVEQVVSSSPKNADFYFLTSCASRLETIGNSTYSIQKKLLEEIGDSFLLIYTAGENFYVPNGSLKNLEVSFNLLTLGGNE